MPERKRTEDLWGQQIQPFTRQELHLDRTDIVHGKKDGRVTSSPENKIICV